LCAVLTTKEYQRFKAECPIFVKQRSKKLQKFYKECLKKGEKRIHLEGIEYDRRD
jgi:hypothetical protein